MIVDADDFCQTNTGIETLLYLKEKRPDFKISLFTIPKLCGNIFIERMKRFSWIEMLPHGEFHPHPRECQDWTYERSKEYLKSIGPLGLKKIFKAPGWQISDGMYRALLEEGYAVADQHYNDERRPKELEVFYPPLHHYHIGHLGGINKNEIGDFTKEILSIDKYEFYERS